MLYFFFIQFSTNQYQLILIHFWLLGRLDQKLIHRGIDMIGRATDGDKSFQSHKIRADEIPELLPTFLRKISC